MTKHPRQWVGEIAIAFLLVLMIPISTPACTDTGGIDLETYNGAWEPTDDTVFAMEMEFNNGQTYIYDFGAPETKLALFDDLSYTNVFFTEIIEDGVSTWYADTVAGGQTLMLGENAHFGISFSKDDETWLDYYLAGESGAYALMASDMDAALLIHDAEMVQTPLPGAALLLGSGLFGLAAVRRRSRDV